MSETHQQVLDRLRQLRQGDAPTHGGRVLSYVYDPGREDIDELAAAAIRIMQPVNGLDPTTFTSVGVLEREVIAFARELLGGDEDVVGSVTAGGTESCLLAVKAARDTWRAAGHDGTPRLLAPSTVHAAFHKAAALFSLELELLPVDPATGTLEARAMTDRLGEDVALAVVSAPCYPFAAMDPVAEVAAACAEAGIACHSDACIGGWILPFWPDADLPPWDLRLPGVTSLSVDLHKYGYAPKGVSLLLQRGRDRQQAQFFATTDWPGYPVVNPTLLSSKSAGALAAAWAIIQVLGREGFEDLATKTAHATATLIDTVRSIEGLRIVGDPTGPLLAVAVDDSLPQAQRVDPHLWADAVRSMGWVLQQQPGYTQADGSHLPATTHFTITPVTDTGAAELAGVLRQAADAVRGQPGITPKAVLANLPAGTAEALAALDGQLPDSTQALAMLQQVGLAGGDADSKLPQDMAPFMALVEALPRPLSARLLSELIARTLS